jgi:hypothetical protein
MSQHTFLQQAFNLSFDLSAADISISSIRKTVNNLALTLADYVLLKKFRRSLLKSQSGPLDLSFDLWQQTISSTSFESLVNRSPPLRKSRMR